ncbi:MAG: glycine betaine ABC transporter substrate-binding protein [Thermovirgaceae bacterium]|nr:glycine betaine ABC transporter substrate-binding protein [Thermovirgaceae bacterium]
MNKKVLLLALVVMVAIGGFYMMKSSQEPAGKPAEEGVVVSGVDPMTYEGTVKVGAQTVNETIVLAWMGKLLLEADTGLTVDINTEFAASGVLHQAMQGKELDIYPTWTGTQLTGILRYEGPNLPADETFKMVKEGFEKNFNATWTMPFGFSNTYVMAVRRETAEKNNLAKASDLKDLAPEWILAGDENFDTRPDAYPGWSEAYGIEFKEVLPMQYSIMYRAIDNKEVDIIAAYATDSRIKKLDLVLLEDDKAFFPDYSAAYVVDMDILKKFPAILPVLEQLSGKIDAPTMSALNGRFDDGEEPEDIAKDFLTQAGLLKK